MGGKITVMIRQRNGKKHSFKAHTSRLERHFGGAKLLDEDLFMSSIKSSGYLKDSPTNFAAHDDYENNSAFFAPYHYGLLLVDFKSQFVFSKNYYSGFMNFTSQFVANDLYKPIRKFSNNVDDFLAWIADFDAPIYAHLLGLYNSVEIGSKIFHRNQLISEGDKSFLEILAIVLGAPQSPSNDVLWAGIKQKSEEIYANDTLELDDFNDIAAHPLGWAIHNGDGSVDYITDVFEYCKKEELLSQDDLAAWVNYLADRQKKTIEA
jgi:hypothetical protein